MRYALIRLAIGYTEDNPSMKTNTILQIAKIAKFIGNIVGSHRFFRNFAEEVRITSFF